MQKVSTFTYDVADYNCVYIYEIPDNKHSGLLKIGKTSFYSALSIAQLSPNCPTLRQAAEQRIDEQTKTALIDYNLLHVELAVKTIKMQDGSLQTKAFDDKDVHAVLLKSKIQQICFWESEKPSEWFKVDLSTAKESIVAVKEGKDKLSSLYDGFGAVNDALIESAIKLRKEQEENVKYTIKMFQKYDDMLWDCKMRYGKTVTAYELIKRQNYKKIIVITHRPAVVDSWRADYNLMFLGTNYKFVTKINGGSIDNQIDYQNEINLKRLLKEESSFIYFASIHDLRGSECIGSKYNKNKTVFEIDWDLLIIDEAHEGTQTDLGDAVIKALCKTNTKKLLLSGTPYNIMSEFQENKYTWTYVDEQRAKKQWYEEFPNEKNPYEDLPTMNILTFDIAEVMSKSYRFVTEDTAFNFKEFFRTWTGDIEEDFYKIPYGKSVGDFVYEDDVNNFLTLISTDDENSNYPFSTEKFRDMFSHTFWIVPGVKEARALSVLLNKHPNFKGKGFEIVNIAGEGDVEKPYDEALSLVKTSIKNFSKTITISCGKLTTGVTVPEWTGVMMLSGSATTAAAGYMQAIFRVQSPGCIYGKAKRNCYVFDFAPDRTLRVIGEVHELNNRGSVDDDGVKTLLGEFINFCPIISISGTAMRNYDVNEMMRQIKKISIDKAINSGFDDDSIYLSDVGFNLTTVDVEILSKLKNVVIPQKKRKSDDIIMTIGGMTDEQRKRTKKAKKKPRKDLSPEEIELLKKEKELKEEQRKIYNLLRAVSIRLPLVFYGVNIDIEEGIELENFVNLVDDVSWAEFMPQGLSKGLFKDILKFYDLDVVTAAGMRIRKIARAADEMPPTERTRRLIEIISKFKNPDKETVLTPWRVVNLHLSKTIGGYVFFDKEFHRELDEPEFVEQNNVSANIFLNPNAKVLEINSKSGLYPLYLAYTFYLLNVTGKEKDLSLDDCQKIWYEVIDKHIFVLCKTEMAKTITKRTLVGYTNKNVNAIYLTQLVERMNDLNRLTRNLNNGKRWGKEEEKMKFDAVVGNPPYQGVNHSQVYPYFYLFAKEITDKYVSLIFPTGWQEPKDGNNLKLLNNQEVKEDSQIVFIDNRQNVFPGISGAEWTNIVLWQKGYDNGLNGEQLVYTNGSNPEQKKLCYDKADIEKPKEILKLKECVHKSKSFRALQELTSSRKPYGLATDVFTRNEYYNLPPFSDKKEKASDIKVLGANKAVKYIPASFPLPRKTQRINKYKVLVPYAWGNMSKTAGLGGAFADIIIAAPKEICTETFQESGCFDTYEMAKKHAKYLMTKFARACLFVNKTSQHSTTAWGSVPIQDYSESWWNKSIEEIDEHLFKKYKLDDNVSAFIRTSFQKRTEANITNFK